MEFISLENEEKIICDAIACKQSSVKVGGITIRLTESVRKNVKTQSDIPRLAKTLISALYSPTPPPPPPKPPVVKQRKQDGIVRGGVRYILG